MLGTIFVTFFLSFYIWHQAESVKLGYETEKLESKIQSLKKEVETLEVDKAEYLSLERVERIATEELKMIPPRKDQIIYEKFHTVPEGTRR